MSGNIDVDGGVYKVHGGAGTIYKSNDAEILGNTNWFNILDA